METPASSRNRRVRAVAHLGLARAVLLEGDDEQAESVAQDALKVLTDHGWRPLVSDALDLLAEIALFRRQHERAVRLAAGARALRGALGLVAFSPDRGRTERLLAAAGPALGDERLNQALDEGARLSLQEAVAYAQRGRGEHASATHGWASLSPVEGQVAELASQGLNNPDIARDLFMSRNTVKAHLSHVYAKLGVANRTELAALAAVANTCGSGGRSDSSQSSPRRTVLAGSEPSFMAEATSPRNRRNLSGPHCFIRTSAYIGCPT